MKVVDSSKNLRYLPARCVHKAAHAYVPAVLVGVWSALVLLDGALRGTRDSVFSRIITLLLLPVVWLAFWVLVLKLIVLVSLIVRKGLRRADGECRIIVSGLFILLGTAGAFCLLRDASPLTHGLGVAWMIGMPLFLLFRAITTSKPRSR